MLVPRLHFRPACHAQASPPPRSHALPILLCLAEVQVLSVSHRRRGSILLDEPPVSPSPPGSLMAGNMLERANTAEEGALDTSPRTVGPRQVGWPCCVERPKDAACHVAGEHGARAQGCEGGCEGGQGS